MEIKEAVIKKNISLWKFDDSIVTDLAERKGLDYSSALRVIIREWAELTAQSQQPQKIETNEQ